ncbi:hypothetical protein EJ02DRAFT_472136 [Clathrospora elynae]|uniref:F-box domain-containing protein n=1 Tax=Clathrospora elynae TaxID=706981 RepID=A0A6A5T7U7_9PLEO|nr:hypothetical protein EJ02DRAFT_472136 [Clathrospora elynae]
MNLQLATNSLIYPGSTARFPEMDANGLVDAFKGLQTNDSRREALAALVNELTPYEWRALHAITSARSFQYDIIGQLPVELVAHIFIHLDTTAPYRLQIVSRRWNHVLRSLHVLKRSLNQWYDGTVDLHDADYTLCQQKAQRVHAFRTGNPNNMYKITPDDADIRDMCLTGDTLSWVPSGNQRLAFVLDLTTWRLCTLSGEAREKIWGLFASDRIVALTTSTNVCYVFDLHGEGRKNFRVPSSEYFKNVTCRFSTVACLASFEEHTSVYIWEYDTQRGRSFQIDHHPGSLFSASDPSRVHTITPLLQPETETMIIFADAKRSKDRPEHRWHIAYSRFTYGGECIGNFQTSLPGIGGIMGWSYVNCFDPIDNKGRFAIRLKSLSREADNNQITSFLLRFDEKLNHLAIMEEPSLLGGPSGSGAVGSIAWWEDTCYGHMYHGGDGERPMLAHMGNSGARCYTPLITESKDAPLVPDIEDVNRSVIMNEKHVIRLAIDRFYVLCFAESDQRPKESGSFFDVGALEVLQ